jgi:hypothetical protein
MALLAATSKASPKEAVDSCSTPRLSSGLQNSCQSCQSWETLAASEPDEFMCSNCVSERFFCIGHSSPNRLRRDDD